MENSHPHRSLCIPYWQGAESLIPLPFLFLLVFVMTDRMIDAFDLLLVVAKKEPKEMVDCIKIRALQAGKKLRR